VSQNKIVITDTSCFILLSKIDAFGILGALFTAVFTTPEIAGEYGGQLPDWIIIQPVKDRALLDVYHQKVDPGEASALALAQEINADLIIIDDLAARKFALKLGLSFKGTLGLLVMAKQEGVIASVRPYLEKVQQTNFRLAGHLIEQSLRDAGE
jgi:predicted nucleic acid-binding protein